MQAQIGGSNTGLVAPRTVAVDASLNVYVFDTTTATISEFAAGATGNVAPIRTISGSNTGLSDGDGFSPDSRSARRAVTSSSRTRYRMQSLSSQRLQAATLRQSKR